MREALRRRLEHVRQAKPRGGEGRERRALGGPEKPVHIHTSEQPVRARWSWKIGMHASLATTTSASPPAAAVTTSATGVAATAAAAAAATATTATATAAAAAVAAVAGAIAVP